MFLSLKSKTKRKTLLKQRYMEFPDNLLHGVDNDVPGVIAGTLYDNKVVYLQSINSTKHSNGSEISTNAAVHLGSCTKAMTACLIGYLIDRKCISLDTLAKDTFADNFTSDSGITIRQLLNHSSGLVENMDWWSFGNDPTESVCSQRLNVAKLALTDTKYVSPMKGAYRYSNVGYVVLGSIIETVLNMSWEDAMHSFIFGPLSMSTAGFGPPTPLTGHHLNRDGVTYTPSMVDNPPVMGPAGRVHCSVPDWALFISEILLLTRAVQGLEAKDTASKLAVSVDTFSELLSVPNSSVKYSGGWIIANRQWANGYCLTHSGSNKAWYAAVWIAPHQNTAHFVAINAGGDVALKTSNDVISRLITKKLSASESSPGLCSIQ